MLSCRSVIPAVSFVNGGSPMASRLPMQTLSIPGREIMHLPGDTIFQSNSLYLLPIAFYHETHLYIP